VSEIEELRKVVHENSIAIARFDGRIKNLEDGDLDRKKIHSQLRAAIIAAIVGAFFTATTLIDMARVVLRNAGK